MSFVVDDGALRAYARQMLHAIGDAQAGRDYIVTHGTMAWHEEGLLNELQPAHERLMAEMTTRLEHLVEIFNQSRAALDGAVGYYRRTDNASAARIDATLPMTPREDEEMFELPPTD
jgi:hypothetical protein